MNGNNAAGFYAELEGNLDFKSWAGNAWTPTPKNPLGAKGIGESGTIGSTPAVHSAVVDALAHLGITHIDMPVTPAKIWAAVASAGNAVSAAS